MKPITALIVRQVMVMVACLMVGFLIGTERYSRLFNPEDFMNKAKLLAGEAARLGCVKTRSKSLNECTAIAEEVFLMLDSIKIKQVNIK